MAIQIDLSTSQYGMPFNGAYFRIVLVNILRIRSGLDYKFEATIDVAGYGATNPGDDVRDIEIRRYRVSVNEIESHQGSSFIEKCYSWVMARPDMAGSQAV